MATYVPTVWVNNTSPALSAANLNKLTDELEAQASEVGIPHTLPNWANNAAPALTDAAPLNEMERILSDVAFDQGLSYTATVWQAGWLPGRNAVNFNKMEVQAAANRAALDQTPSGTLTWTPPGYPSYAGYQQRVLSNSGSQPTGGRTHTATPGTGIDAVFTVAETLTGRVIIDGFRNVVLIGGKINQLTVGGQQVGISIDRCSGTVHIEGLEVTGTQLVDAIIFRTGHVPPQHGATVQLQNCRFESTYSDGSFHGDALQLQGAFDSTWLGGVGHLRIDHCTFRTWLQGIFLGNHGAGQVIQSGDFRNFNIVKYGPLTGYSWFFAKPLRRDISNIWPNSVIDIENGWMTGPADSRHSAGWHGNVLPQINGYDGGVSVPDDPTRASHSGADATGQYVYWEPTSDIQGIIRIGDPDFAPLGIGVNYVSPGYV